MGLGSRGGGCYFARSGRRRWLDVVFGVMTVGHRLKFVFVFISCLFSFLLGMESETW